MAAFSQKDCELVISSATEVDDGGAGTILIPLVPQVMVSHNDIDMDPGGDAEHLVGHGIVPIATLVKSAKGKMSISFSNGVEVKSARRLVGGIGSACIVTIVEARAGMVPVSYVFFARWKNNATKFDEAKGWSDKVDLLFTDCLEDSLSIYNQFA